jgi:hypothetical protein
MPQISFRPLTGIGFGNCGVHALHFQGFPVSGISGRLTANELLQITGCDEDCWQAALDNQFETRGIYLVDGRSETGEHCYHWLSVRDGQVYDSADHAILLPREACERYPVGPLCLLDLSWLD